MLRVGLALLFGTLMQAQPQVQTMEAAGTQLADRISSLLQRRTTVSLEFQNLTALPPAESSNFRAALQQALRKAGVETVLGTNQTEQPELRVTISENVRGLLFVATVSAGENRQVSLLPWSMPQAAPHKPRVRITLQAMLEQSEPVLDLLLLDSELLVLSPSKVSSYRMEGAKWTPAGIAGVSWARPLPRDPRGRLEIAPGGFRVFVPGTSCNGTIAPDFKITCTPGNDTWPVNPRDSSSTVRWVTDRNVLDGGASEGTPIENPCGPGWLMLNSAAGDAEDRDQVQAYERVDGVPTAASDPLFLAGPVTALWPSETPGQASVVIRNSKTGNYEASRLGVACAE
ncbi:MAG TPA: hypothetical protein VKT81_10905 [Bryobacteraceae bacterium]|nr:hypothetical protein [Bryobacteraceae bacterium]